MPVVDICRNGYTRDIHLSAFVRIIWFLTAQFDIELQVYHVHSRDNKIADLLLRWCDSNSGINKLINGWITLFGVM